MILSFRNDLKLTVAEVFVRQFWDVKFIGANITFYSLHSWEMSHYLMIFTEIFISQRVTE